MLDTMKKDVLNVITQGTVDGGAAKKGKKSEKSKKSKKSKPKASKSVKRKVVKQPIGYVWKMSNVNGKITRELHPIYSTANANKEMKMMEKRMNKMLKDIKL